MSMTSQSGNLQMKRGAGNLAGKQAANGWQWSVDTQYRVNSISSRFAEIVGQQFAKKMIGKTFWEFVDGTEVAKDSWQVLADAFTQKDDVDDFVFSIKTPDSAHHFIISGQPIFSQGKFMGYKGTGNLASEDMVAKSDLSQNRLSVIFKDIDFGLGVLSQDKKLLEFNSFFYDEFLKIGLKTTPYMPMSDIAAFLSSKTKPVSFNGEFKKLVNSVQFLDKDPFTYVFKAGSDQYFQLSKKKRSQIFYALHLEDVSGHYQTREAMRAEIDTHKQRISVLEKRLRSFEENSLKSMREITRLSTEKNISYQNFAEIIEMAGIALLRSDLMGNIEYINYKGVKALGFMSIADFKKKHDNLYTGFYPSFYDRAKNELHVKQNFSNMQDEITLELPGNRKKYFNQTLIPIIDTNSEQVSGFYTLLIDMTDHHSQQKLIKNQETTLKNLSDFRFDMLSKISQNISKPLKRIEKQSHDIVEEIDIDHPVYKKIQKISKTSKQSIEQLDILSVISEVQAKRYVMQEKISNIAQHLMQVCQDKNLPVCLETPEQIDRFYLVYDTLLLEKTFISVVDRFAGLHKHKNSTIEFIIGGGGTEISIRIIAPFSDDDEPIIDALEKAEAAGQDVTILESVLSASGLYDPSLLIADVVMRGHDGRVSFKGHKGFNTTLLLHFPADRIRQKPSLSDDNEYFEISL